MAQPDCHLLFVYGTLKRGQPNHSRFQIKELGKATFLCSAETVDRLPLVVATRFSIPYLLCKPGLGNHVKGELYEIDDKMLTFCDDFEDHPIIYERTMIDVKVTSDSEKYTSGDNIKCWCYILKKFKADLLHLPLLESYDVDKVENKYDRAEGEDGGLQATMDDLGIVPS